jgi:hypothetical protein
MAAFRRFEALREAVFTVVIPAILRVRSLGWKAERFEKDEGLREVVQTGRDVW